MISRDLESSERMRRKDLISKLTNLETDLEDRIAAAGELFPESRHIEKLSVADRDASDRPVRYFRLMTYEELNAILNCEHDESFQNPAAKEIFSKNSNQIRADLESYLNQEGLLGDLRADYENLIADFTLKNLQNFLQTKIPRVKLYELHKRIGNFCMFTGLNSLSVGAPYQTPLDPEKGRLIRPEGMPVVEFSIPNKEVTILPEHLNNGVGEMEKEVCVSAIRQEWIAAVYNGNDDFICRFVLDQSSALYPEYAKVKNSGKLVMDYLSHDRVFDILQQWKQKESIKNLIPNGRQGELDDLNPDLLKPFLRQS